MQKTRQFLRLKVVNAVGQRVNLIKEMAERPDPGESVDVSFGLAWGCQVVGAEWIEEFDTPPMDPMYSDGTYTLTVFNSKRWSEPDKGPGVQESQPRRTFWGWLRGE